MFLSARNVQIEDSAENKIKKGYSFQEITQHSLFLFLKAKLGDHNPVAYRFRPFF